MDLGLNTADCMTYSISEANETLTGILLRSALCCIMSKHPHKPFNAFAHISKLKFILFKHDMLEKTEVETISHFNLLSDESYHNSEIWAAVSLGRAVCTSKPPVASLFHLIHIRV